MIRLFGSNNLFLKIKFNQNYHTGIEPPIVADTVTDYEREH